MSTESAVQSEQQVVLDRGDLDRLIEALRARFDAVIGPVARDGAIVYEPIESAADLPAGWTDEQEAGTYRLVRRSGGALFDYTVGPSSWKRFLFPPRVRLWRALRSERGLEIVDDAPPSPRLAFLGVRACELAAIAVHDRVLLQDSFADPVYRARRESAFLVSVHCGRAGRTCFCASMGTGPRALAGFDLALTEVAEEGRGHFFVVEVGSGRGAEVMSAVPARPARTDEIQAAAVALAGASAQMGRSLEAAGLPERLAGCYDHPRWDAVADRCLACGNCTQVCPTCFCTTIEDTADLKGVAAERVRRWDSCFTLDHSYIHGGSVRPSTRARYRQWLVHKLGTWHPQYGSSGCVGCGRCITWCPAGIDLTEEAQALRGHEGKEEKQRADS